MRKRRFIQSSDDEADEDLGGRFQSASQCSQELADKLSNTKKLGVEVDQSESLLQQEIEARKDNQKVHDAKDNEMEEEDNEEDREEDEEPPPDDATPIGEIVKTTGKGKSKKNHYRAFEFDGTQYELEDSVLLTPGEASKKPYVAIIKDITQSGDGSLMVTGQWFYRPEETYTRTGVCKARDTRELYYSFHHDDVPAESVMHKCVVHFIPLNKQLPRRSQHPGFIVQKVYDTVERKLWRLTDKDYEDSKQYEIDLLVDKTTERLGELPEIEVDGFPTLHEDNVKNRKLKRKLVPPINVLRTEGEVERNGQTLKPDTPDSCRGDDSPFYKILAGFKVLTRDAQRDSRLKILLEAIHYAYNSKEGGQLDDKEKNKLDLIDQNRKKNDAGAEIRSFEIQEEGIVWPDDAVSAVVALENTCHETLGCNFKKYSEKMRKMLFNLKANWPLTRRLLRKELEASVVLNMSDNELKGALTREEEMAKEPEILESMQMAEEPCSICSQKSVYVDQVFSAGRYRYQCTSCGNTFFGTADLLSPLVDAPNVAGNVGTAPWATEKRDAAEKKMFSPRAPDNLSSDIFQKLQKHPKLETQKSLNRLQREERGAPVAAENAES